MNVTTGRWFTNTMHPRADIKDWQSWSKDSRIASGPPRPSAKGSLEWMLKQKLAGLYVVIEGEPRLPAAEDCPGYVA